MKKQFTIPSLILAVAVSLIAFKAIDGTYTVNSTESKLKWTGYHLAKSYEHWGYVNLKSGSVDVSNGKITSGEFVIDMTTISNKDVEGEKDSQKLDGHLKSDDFFAVEKHPEAKLVIKKVNDSGKATGDLTIRGITKEIQFDTKVEEASNNKVVATADIKVDRTEFKVMYGWKLENAILSNEFRLEVQLVANQ
ncbi:MAG: YceI family protein [Bacteroidota bacterium]